MENSSQAYAVRFHDIEFRPEGVTLLSYQSKLLFLAKQDIRQITLKQGFQSERPIAEVGFGFVIIGLGLYFFANFVLQAFMRGIIYLGQLLSLFLLPIGGWFILDGLRKRLYFEVVLDGDQRKLPLGKNPDKHELRNFVSVASQLGYVIDTRLLDQID